MFKTASKFHECSCKRPVLSRAGQRCQQDALGAQHCSQAVLLVLHTGALEPGLKYFGMPYVTPVSVYVEVKVLSTSMNSEYNKCTEEGKLTDFYIPGLENVNIKSFITETS